MSLLIKQKQIENLLSDLSAKALDSAVVKKSNNLSDVTASTARGNLDVYSKSEVQSMVAGADNAVSVADLTARAALTGLKVTDRVFVANDGDGKWALYIVTAITNGSGSTSTFVKVADEDIFTNAMSASAIKTAYESNANTNAFTDAEKTKVGHITVTQAVDLDDMESDIASNASAASTAQSTANTAVSNAATAQTTANNAESAAATAQTTANTAVSDAADAQATADDAMSDAATAQSTANTAVSNAATAQSAANAAQSTANSALSTANSKEAEFTEEREDFTTKTGAANTPVQLNLAHPLADGFVPRVYFNGIQVDNVTYNPGQPMVEFQVPYILEVSDVLTVFYSWR